MKGILKTLFIGDINQKANTRFKKSSLGFTADGAPVYMYEVYMYETITKLERKLQEENLDVIEQIYFRHLKYLNEIRSNKKVDEHEEQNNSKLKDKSTQNVVILGPKNPYDLVSLYFISEKLFPILDEKYYGNLKFFIIPVRNPEQMYLVGSAYSELMKPNIIERIRKTDIEDMIKKRIPKLNKYGNIFKIPGIKATTLRKDEHSSIKPNIDYLVANQERIMNKNPKYSQNVWVEMTETEKEQIKIKETELERRVREDVEKIENIKTNEYQNKEDLLVAEFMKKISPDLIVEVESIAGGRIWRTERLADVLSNFDKTEKIDVDINLKPHLITEEYHLQKNTPEITIDLFKQNNNSLKIFQNFYKLEVELELWAIEVLKIFYRYEEFLEKEKIL